MDWLPVVALVVLAAALLWQQTRSEARFRALLEAPRPADPAIPLLQQQIESLRGQVQLSIDSLRGQVQQTLSADAGQTQDRLAETTAQLLQQLNAVQSALDERLKTSSELVQQTTAQVGQRLDTAARVVGEVQNRLGTLEGASQKIFDLGKDLAGLQEILRSQKARGVLGEQMLENLLTEVLPREHVSLQHAFKDGEKVDVLLRLADGGVAIDAKFPLENFRRAVAAPEAERAALWSQFGRDARKHIDDIARKYIRPDEGTLDFAFLYVPAESVYYEMAFGTAVNREGESVAVYAQRKRVILTSPATLFAYLQTVLMGLKSLQIEREAQTIQANLARLRGDLARFQDLFGKMGTHLKNAGTSYGEAEKKLERLGDRLEGIATPEPSAPDSPDAPSGATPPPTKPGNRELWRIA
ncbi:MAG: DNA recombination protein RmuC [Planctomycetes bacterium]|nr:DNA recombination protein RmuC [Planctomycetota bacterium]